MKPNRLPMIEEKIEVLHLVRKSIESKAQVWICYALMDVARDSIRLRTAAEHLERYVSRALDPEPVYEEPISTLYYWILKHRPDMIGAAPDAELRNYRLQWIDWMLACLNEDLEKERSKK